MVRNVGGQNRRKGIGCCLPVILVFLALITTAIWTGIIPVRNFVHVGSINISVGDTPRVFVFNEARGNSSLRTRDVAPLQIRSGGETNQVVINEINAPLISTATIKYRQSADRNTTFITVDYNYRGTIEIIVPQQVLLSIDSYENGVDIEGVTGRLAVYTYKGKISIKNSILTLPSVFDAYEDDIIAEQITLEQPAAFTTYKGSVTYQGNLAPSGAHFFTSYEKAVNLSIPSSSTFLLDARTSQGTVFSDFPGLQSQGNNKDHLTGQVGASSLTLLYATTYSDDITITMAKGA